MLFLSPLDYNCFVAFLSQLSLVPSIYDTSWSNLIRRCPDADRPMAQLLATSLGLHCCLCLRLLGRHKRSSVLLCWRLPSNVLLGIEGHGGQGHPGPILGHGLGAHHSCAAVVCLPLDLLLVHCRGRRRRVSIEALMHRWGWRGWVQIRPWYPSSSS